MLKSIDYQDEVIQEMMMYSTKTLAFPGGQNSLRTLINITPTILLHATTGSGKTVIMSRFLNDLLDDDSDLDNDNKLAIIWLCIGQGGLVEQSQKRIREYARNLNCIGPQDITSGSKTHLTHRDALFLSWDKLNNQDKRTGEWTNILMRDGEGMNLPKLMENTHLCQTKIILVIDESHVASDSERSKAIKSMISPDLIINVTATPSKKLVKEVTDLACKRDNITNTPMGLYVKVDTTKVIEAGMIKQDLIINQGVSAAIHSGSKAPIPTILEGALQRRDELEKLFAAAYAIGSSARKINPLLLIQISDADKGEEDKKEVIEFLRTKGIEFPSEDNPNGTLACWFSKQPGDENAKINLDGIEKLDGKQKVLLFKTAIATGWDCPRAYILVKFRESASTDTPFNRQVVGRILRMPEQCHYPSGKRTSFASLNKAYIYTNEEKFSFEMDNTQDMSEDALDKINIYTTSLCLQDKFSGMFEFSVQLPLPSYSVANTQKEFSEQRFTDKFIGMFSENFEKMMNFAEEHPEKMNINFLLDTSYGVDKLELSELSDEAGGKGTLRLQSNLIKLKLNSLFRKVAGSRANAAVLMKLLNNFRLYLSDMQSDTLNPVMSENGKSMWSGQPGVRKFNSILYINQYNPDLNMGFIGNTGTNKENINYLESFLRSMFITSYITPNHTISAKNLTKVVIPREVVLEVVNPESEYYDVDDNNCLYGLMPNIKYKQLKDYIDSEIIDNPNVKWWYPNWLGSAYQIKLPYIDSEGLLKTTKPDIIVNQNNKRVYTFIPKTIDQYNLACEAVENFKSICSDTTVDYLIVEPSKIKEKEHTMLPDDDALDSTLMDNDFSDISAMSFDSETMQRGLSNLPGGGI